jgi:O-antigen/teichoic acid export membrane protein
MVIPLSLGSAAMIFVFLVDNLFVQGLFTVNRDLYIAGQNSGFALNQITTPISIVMFSKIARNATSGKDTGTLALTLKSTLFLGGAMALACIVVPSLPLRLVYFTSYEKVAAACPLVPWSVWTMLIFSLANVLASGLLARKAFAIVPWLVVLAAGYGVTLWAIQGYLLSLETFTAFRRVIQVQMLFSLLLLSVTIWFSRPGAPDRPNPSAEGAALS